MSLGFEITVGNLQQFTCCVNPPVKQSNCLSTLTNQKNKIRRRHSTIKPQIQKAKNQTFKQTYTVTCVFNIKQSTICNVWYMNCL
jgi:hypothetical protein